MNRHPPSRWLVRVAVAAQLAAWASAADQTLEPAWVGAVDAAIDWVGQARIDDRDLVLAADLRGRVHAWHAEDGQPVPAADWTARPGVHGIDTHGGGALLADRHSVHCVALEGARLNLRWSWTDPHLPLLPANADPEFRPPLGGATRAGDCVLTFAGGWLYALAQETGHELDRRACVAPSGPILPRANPPSAGAAAWVGQADGSWELFEAVVEAADLVLRREPLRQEPALVQSVQAGLLVVLEKSWVLIARSGARVEGPRAAGRLRRAALECFANEASPARGLRFIVVSLAEHGELAGFDLQTGATVWTQRLEATRSGAPAEVRFEALGGRLAVLERESAWLVAPATGGVLAHCRPRGAAIESVRVEGGAFWVVWRAADGAFFLERAHVDEPPSAASGAEPGAARPRATSQSPTSRPSAWRLADAPPAARVVSQSGRLLVVAEATLRCYRLP